MARKTQILLVDDDFSVHEALRQALQNEKFQVVSAARVIVRWQGGSGPYQVRRRSALNTGSVGGTTYSYTVSAMDNARNQSAKSLSVSRITRICIGIVAPSVPGGFAALAMSCNQINLSGNAAIDSGGSGIKGYNVYRNGGFLKQVLVPATFNRAHLGFLQPQRGYGSKPKVGAQRLPWVKDERVAATPTGLWLNGYLPQPRWGCRPAMHTQGSSCLATLGFATESRCWDSPPRQLQERTLRYAPSNTDPGLSTATPSVPTGLNVTPATCNQINLYWNASTDLGAGIGAYNVFRNGMSLKHMLCCGQKIHESHQMPAEAFAKDNVLSAKSSKKAGVFLMASPLLGENL